MPTLIDKLQKFFFGNPNKRPSNQGSIYPLGYLTRQQRKLNLEIPYQPVRPVLNSHETSRNLLEIAKWCYEVRHGISNVSRDCFQSLDGKIQSWRIDTEYQGKSIHKDVIDIGNNLASRQYGKDYVLGGNKLKKACADMLFYGDSFLELGISQDENKKYYISKSIYLPSLSTFVDVDEKGDIQSFIQRDSLYKNSNDIIISPVKVLQFSYEKEQIYGEPITLQSLDSWRKLKELSADIEQAARDTGNSILKHTMPEDSTEETRNKYAMNHENLLNQGIITNLFLMPGVTVERIANDSQSLEPLLKLWLQTRYQCIPPGIPLWFFPGLGLESAAGKDISNQPALNYARFIAYLRSVLGEQIKYAISLEIVLQKGFDFYLENQNFDIRWADWQVLGLEKQESL